MVMKKFLSLVLVTTLCLGVFCSCKKEDKGEDTKVVSNSIVIDENNPDLTPEMLFTPVEIATTHQSQDKVSNLVLDYDDKMKTVTYPLLERISQRDIVLQREMSQIDISDVNEFLNLYKLYVTGTKGDFDLKPGYGLVCDESGKPLSLVARTLVSSDDAFASDYLYLSYSGLLILTQFNETLLYTTVKKASEELRENIITGKRVSISLRKYTDETKIH